LGQLLKRGATVAKNRQDGGTRFRMGGMTHVIDVRSGWMARADRSRINVAANTHWRRRGDNMEIAYALGFLLFWFVLQFWVLPKFGVKT
jgi:hypothetical protein